VDYQGEKKRMRQLCVLCYSLQFSNLLSSHEGLKATHPGTIGLLYNIAKIEKLPYPPQLTLQRYQG
jgi:hypothetical protein